MPHADTTTDGRRDFDFLYGDWLIHNRKLVNSADPDCAEWIEFEATGSAHPILNGLGNMDSFTVLDGPGDMAGLEGASLRLYDTARGLWRIWWMSNRVPGQLDPPVEGRWVDGESEFV